MKQHLQKAERVQSGSKWVSKTPKKKWILHKDKFKKPTKS